MYKKFFLLLKEHRQGWARFLEKFEKKGREGPAAMGEAAINSTARPVQGPGSVGITRHRQGCTPGKIFLVAQERALRAAS